MIYKDGGVTAAKGYKATGTACGLKKDNIPDLAVVASDVTAVTAGVYTKNVVKGHSLQLTMENLKDHLANAIVINSGCANACLGIQGKQDAVKITEEAARLLNVNAKNILVGSTGVIGKPLNMEKVVSGLNQAIPSLSYEGGHLAEEAIMTTDTVPKEYAVEIDLDGIPVTVGGMAKGSGMIHPNMATMISVITTDLSIEYNLLQKALSEITEISYNKVSVDGDTSVCDMVILMANGTAGNHKINEENENYQLFYKALTEVCLQLSKMLAKDGEGATKLLEITVKNGVSQDQTNIISNSIIRSPLFKTAMFGEDANWGRIITAAGYSGADFDPDKVDIYIGKLMVCKNGTALPFDEDEALQILKSNEIEITVDLKSGTYTSTAWTCDFSYDYVKINGSYRS